jgi:hemerythrin superfamily protein
MEFWETTKFSKWYKSHRRFSFTAKYCIELYKDSRPIPETIFKPFLKSLYCHSKSEENMFRESPEFGMILEEHSKIDPSKEYSNEDKYWFCKSLLTHMKQEEEILYQKIVSED